MLDDGVYNTHEALSPPWSPHFERRSSAPPRGGLMLFGGAVGGFMKTGNFPLSNMLPYTFLIG